MEGFAESMPDSLSDQHAKLIEIGKHEELFLENGDQHSHDEEHGSHSHDKGMHHEGEKRKHGKEEAEHRDHAGHSPHGHNHGARIPIFGWIRYG